MGLKTHTDNAPIEIGKFQPFFIAIFLLGVIDEKGIIGLINE